ALRVREAVRCLVRETDADEPLLPDALERASRSRLAVAAGLRGGLGRHLGRGRRTAATRRSGGSRVAVAVAVRGVRDLVVVTGRREQAGHRHRTGGNEGGASQDTAAGDQVLTHTFHSPRCAAITRSNRCICIRSRIPPDNCTRLSLVFPILWVESNPKGEIASKVVRYRSQVAR